MFRKIVAGNLIMLLIFISAGIALAGETNNHQQNKANKQHIEVRKNFEQNMAQNFKTKLDALITAGTISQDQETVILNTLKKPAKENGKRPSITRRPKNKLDSLVTDGKITQGQKLAIIKSLQATKGGAIKTKLDALVTDGEISKDQETAVITLFRPIAKGNTNKVNRTPRFKKQLDTLVAAGTISQDQETAVLNALKLTGAGHAKGQLKRQ